VFQKYLERLLAIFEWNLPPNLNSLDAKLDYILPLVQKDSEDLVEEEFYLRKRWIEVRDDDRHLETVLHIFMPAKEYLISIDGDITKGSWWIMPDSNALIVEYGGKSQLFDLEFLNDDFFILAKNGDQMRKGKPKYTVYASEELVEYKNLDWHNCMEELFNIHRNQLLFSAKVIIGLIIIVAAAVFYFF